MSWSARVVMQRVVKGHANKVIAMDLGVSQRTVELHRARVMHKLKMRSLADLVSAIGKIKKMVDYYSANSPLPESVTAREVGTVAAFLASSLGTGITGTVIHVDKGYHSMGMAPHQAMGSWRDDGPPPAPET